MTKPNYNIGWYPIEEARPHPSRPDNKYALVCPLCINHEQGDPMDYCDCKNVFFYKLKDGKEVVVGQCCCYGPDHGKR